MIVPLVIYGKSYDYGIFASLVFISPIKIKQQRAVPDFATR